MMLDTSDTRDLDFPIREISSSCRERLATSTGRRIAFRASTTVWWRASTVRKMSRPLGKDLQGPFQGTFARWMMDAPPQLSMATCKSAWKKDTKFETDIQALDNSGTGRSCCTCYLKKFYNIYLQLIRFDLVVYKYIPQMKTGHLTNA